MKKLSLYAILVAVAQIQAQILPWDVEDVGAWYPADVVDQPPGSANPVRAIQWSHPNGNLVPNWSFENSQEYWKAGGAGLVRVASTSAKSGAFVAMAKPGQSGAGLESQSGLIADDKPIMLKRDQGYVLSFYYKSNAATNIYPSVQYVYRTAGGTYTVSGGVGQAGSVYSQQSNWTLYTMVLAPPAGVDCMASITLVNAPSTIPSTTNLYFDDVMLVEGTSGSPSLDRNQILTNVSVSDPTGLALSSASGSGADANYLVGTVEYDNFWRKTKGYLPFTTPVANALSEPTSPLASAKSAWPAAGNTPFSQVAYPTSAKVGQTESGISGDAWAIGGTTNLGTGHTSMSGSIFVSTLPTTETMGSVLPGQAFETYYETTVGEKNYVMSWSRDADNVYAVQWSNIQGQLQASAKLLDRPAGNTNPRQWTWALTTYQYYDNGALKSVTAPRLVAGGTVSPRVTSYDFQGRVVAVTSPDFAGTLPSGQTKAITQYWYDQAGRLRFWQDPIGASANWVYWRRYDALGRPVIEGVSALKPTTDLRGTVQTMAETPGSEQNWYGTSYVTSATYTKGWIYDQLNASDVYDRTGVTLSSILGSATFAGTNGQGRLVAQYNLNPFYNPTPAGGQSLATTNAKLVMDLYSYDGMGRPKILGKYIGTITDAARRSQSIEYRYDSASRVASILVDKSMDQTLQPDASRQLDAKYFYTYDDKGRVSVIKDGTDLVAQYTYDTYGRMTKVILGATSATANFAYHLHGQVQSISTKTGAAGNGAYQENLGYESPLLNTATTGVAAPTPSYAGRITQAVHQYGTDQNIDPTRTSGIQSLKAVTYTYDAAGRMTENKTNVPTNPVTGFPASVAIPFNATPVPVLSASYLYDENDRISKTKWGSSASATLYSYTSGKNLLDHVTGTITPASSRNAGATGNFQYDQAGNMLSDASLGRTVTFGLGGLPTAIKLTGTNFVMSKYPLYDADGQMVSYVSTISNPGGQGISSKYHYVRIGGFTQKEIGESWTYNGGGSTVSTYVANSAQVIVNYRGQSATVGRKLMGSTVVRQFYVKDHQGSTIRLVNNDGSSAGAFDYYGYGDERTIQGEATKVTSKYTGKESFSTEGLQYFGARWYDPQLGIWISQDPLHQYANSFGFAADPAMSVDPNGLFSLGSGLVLSYSRKHGFGIGLGLEFGAFGISETWNAKDNSWTSSASAGVGGCYGVCGNLGVTGSYNTKSGSSITEEAGVGVGLGNFTVGGGATASQYWNTDGDYMGGTYGTYGEVGFKGMANLRGGHEWGYDGMQGRGWYGETRANAGPANGYGSLSENGGWDAGGGLRLNVMDYRHGAWHNGVQDLREQVSNAWNYHRWETNDGRLDRWRSEALAMGEGIRVADCLGGPCPTGFPGFMSTNSEFESSANYSGYLHVSGATPLGGGGFYLANDGFYVEAAWSASPGAAATVSDYPVSTGWGLSGGGYHGGGGQINVDPMTGRTSYEQGVGIGKWSASASYVIKVIGY